MTFVGIEYIAKSVEVPISSITDAFIQRVRDEVLVRMKSEKELIISGQSFSFENILYIIDELNVEKNRIFHDWINQDKTLSTFLFSNGKTVLTDNNCISYEGHQLFKGYKNFLSTYLTPVLTQEISTALASENFNRLPLLLPFGRLIPNDNRIEIQRPISQLCRECLQTFQEEKTKTAEKLNCIFNPLFAQTLNELDNHFYSNKILFIDTAQAALAAPSFPKGYQDKIQQTLLLLELNTNHKEQVQAFCQSSFFNPEENKIKNSTRRFFRSPVFYLLIAVLLIGVFYILSNAISASQNSNGEISGGDAFSEDELVELDSVLKFQAKDSVPVHVEDIHPTLAPPAYILSASGDSITNDLAKELYESMLEDYQIQFQQGGNNCSKTGKDLYGLSLYNGLSPINSSSSANHTISNQSADDLFLLHYTPTKNGKVYGKLIAPGRSTKIQLEKGDEIIFYTGSQMNPFNPMKAANNGYGTVADAKRISKIFDYHFCKQNNYNLQLLNKIFTVKEIKAETILSGDSYSGFDVKSESLSLKELLF